MSEAVFFRNLTTKGLTAINSGERYFEGWLTVQVKDKQGEVTIVDELMKVLPVWIDRGAPISDTHSNRIIGKGINYSKAVYKDTDGTEYPAIKITGKIHKNYELDNDIWGKIKSGEYKGLSFGGATKSDREPMQMKDGSIAYSLKDLEHYEVAVCRDPAVPLALITEFNTLAKAAVEGEDIGGGRMLIKCSKYGCYVDKDNKEAGLKAPEAAREALVYDDKTHDQPSETPKVVEDLGKGDCEFCRAAERDATTMVKSPDDPTASGEEKGRMDQFATHQAHHRKKKGEDWSNADGDKHSMYNQDTDEGGMGKHKQKREVGTGYGAEQNSTGEVGWSGGGSPYPKIAAMNNVITRLKIIETLKKSGAPGEFKQSKERDTRDSLAQDHAGQSTIAREHPGANAHYIASRRAGGAKTGLPHSRNVLSVTNDPKSGKGVSGIVDRQTNWDGDTITAGRAGQMVRHNPKFSEGIPPTGKRSRKERERGTMGEYLRNTIADPTKKSIMTNILSRLKSLKLKTHELEHAKEDIDIHIKEMKKLKKEGEFGGMNQGETEWTEPRDTANDRRDSNFKKKPQI